MICPSCNSEVTRIQYFATASGVVKQCRECPDKYVPPALFNYKQGSFVYTKSGKMTSAHNEDISRRKIDPVTKKVYRDYGKKSFTLY